MLPSASQKARSATSSLREQGNALYKKGDLQGALSLYTEAVVSGDPLAAGNRAAALFELCRYEEAEVVAKTAAEEADAEAATAPGENDAAMRAERLRLRAAKAAALMTQWQAVEHHAARAGAAGRPWVDVAKFWGGATTDCGDVGRIRETIVVAVTRSTLRFAESEYFLWGHDDPKSMLRSRESLGGLENETQSEFMAAGAHADAERFLGKRFWDMKTMASAQEPLRLFLGGCGDARHMFETIRDVGADLESSGTLRDCNANANIPELRIVLNDVKVEHLARAMVVLSLLYKLGGYDTRDLVCDRTRINGLVDDVLACQQRLETDAAYSAALEAATAVYHTYMSPFLLPHHQTQVLEVINSFSQLHGSLPEVPWLSQSQQQHHWDRICDVFKYWASQPIDSDFMSSFVYQLHEEEQRPDMAEFVDEATNRHKQEMKHQIASFDAMSDAEFLALLGEGAGMDGVEVEEKRKCIRQIMLDEMSKDFREDDDYDRMDLATSGFLCGAEVLFAKKEKILSPPIELWHKYSRYLEGLKVAARICKPPVDDLFCQIVGLDSHESTGSRTRMDGSNSSIWAANPTAVPMDCKAKDIAGRHRFQIPNVIAKNIGSFVSSKHNGDHDNSHNGLHRCLWDTIAPWLLDVASAVRTLADAGCLKIEFCPGDMHHVASQQARGSFHSVWLSNVPDYTGLLNTFLFMGALLRPRFEGISVLRHKTSLATDKFKNLTDYVHSSTLQSSVQRVAAKLGFCLVSGSLFLESCWMLEPLGMQRPLDDEITPWLNHLLLGIALPAPRHATANITSPLTLVTFLELLAHLCAMGAPRHILARHLEALCANSVQSNATPPSRSPNPCNDAFEQTRKKSKHLELEPLLPELRAFLSEYLHRKLLDFGMCVALAPAHWYTWPEDVVGEIDDNAYVPSEGNPYFPVLGMIIFPVLGREASQAEAQRYLLTKDGPQGLRDLHNLSRYNAAIISAVRWIGSSSKRRLGIFLTRDDYWRTLQENYFGMLIRTDSWSPLRMELLPLRQTVQEV